MAARKAAKPRSEPRLVKQPHGGALKQGGVNPGSGRPPDQFKAMCRELVTRDATWKAVSAILEVPEHPHYMSALKWAAEHGYGKPKESVDLNLNGEVTVRQEWTFGKRKVGF